MYEVFSKDTIYNLRPILDISVRHQQRALDVTLACKLTHVYGKISSGDASQRVGHERGADDLSAGRTAGGDDESDNRLSVLTIGFSTYARGEYG